MSAASMVSSTFDSCQFNCTLYHEQTWLLSSNHFKRTSEMNGVGKILVLGGQTMVLMGEYRKKSWPYS